LKISRVQEILQSEEKIDVMMQGNPIWIVSLDELNETVKVHLENDPQQEQEVAITRIHE
jgi:small acid-soluble spore protein H (minor)